MRYKLLIVFIFLVSTVFAQKVDFKTVDAKTYQAYMAGSWDSLLYYGKLAQKQDIDYFYLNYRMGVAYFKRGDYQSASFHLEKALLQNSSALSNPHFQQTLFYAYLYTMQNKKALSVALGNDSLRKLIPRSTLYFYGGGGSSFNIDYNSIGRPDHGMGGSGQAEAVLYGRYQDSQGLGGISYDQIFNGKLNLSATISAFRFNDFSSYEDRDSLLVQSFPIYQQNFSLVPGYAFNNKWSMSIALGLVHNTGEPYVVSYTNNPYAPYSFEPMDFDETNFLLGANIYRSFRKSRLGLEIGTSNYSSRSQFQFGLNYMIYPFGNLNLYSLTSLALKHEDKTNNLIFYQLIGFKMAARLWGEVEGTFGEMKNFNVFSLGYGYNTTDHLNMMLAGKLIFVAGKQIDLFVRGKFYKRHGLYNVVMNDGSTDISKLFYNYWSVSAGLKWKFNYKNK